MKIPYTICLSVILFVTGSCTTKKEKKQPSTTNEKIVSPVQYDRTLKKGEVLARIVCKNDTDQHYALYLPSYYSVEKSWPVIYFFDPHAVGSSPVSKYKELAEKYGYIIAGSNNSQNGTAWETTDIIVKLFFNDLVARVRIDNTRVYTGGFSGGARVAASVAIFNGGIAGVIACGAGFPGIDKPIENHFDFIGIAGESDFNSTELKQLDKALDNSQFRHQLVSFDGKHEWCPLETMEEAFIWTELNAMKDNLAPRNDTLISVVVKDDVKRIKEFEKKKDSYNELLACKKLVNFCDGLADVSIYKEKLATLQNSIEIKNRVKKNGENEVNELQQQQQYSSALQTQSFEWWQAELNKINTVIRQKGNSEEGFSNKRLLGYLGLAAYMNSINALKVNRYNDAGKSLEIFKLMEPTNVDVPYLFACLYAEKGDPSTAIIELKNAVKLGFKDVKKINTDPMLSSLRGSMALIELEKQIEQ